MEVVEVESKGVMREEDGARGDEAGGRRKE